MGKVLRGRLRTLQAAGLLVLTSAAQKLVPMPRWAHLIGEPVPVPEAWRGAASKPLPVRCGTIAESQVAWSVGRASRRLPWQPSCLAQAAAAQIMLRRRGEGGRVVVGLRRDPDAPTGWGAHAWLVGVAGTITGGPAAEGFTPTVVFAFPDRGPRPGAGRA